MENCKKQAYASCEIPMKHFYLKCRNVSFNGCGKRLCEDHIEIHYDRFCQPILWHCKHGEKVKNKIGDIRTDCGVTYNNELWKKTFLQTFFIMSILLAMLIVYFQESTGVSFETWTYGPTFDVDFDKSKQ
jgi:hypothetical protein